LAIKDAIANARHEFNDELYDYLMKKTTKNSGKFGVENSAITARKLPKYLMASLVMLLSVLNFLYISSQSVSIIPQREMQN